MSIYKKLNDARKQFHQRQLKKSGYNTYGQYKYFELGDFLIPAIEIFDKLDLCAIVSFTKDLATMTIVDIDDPSNQVVITSPFGSAQLKASHEIQNIGACETYQRRYLWMAALEIVEHDALDSSEGVDELAELKAHVAVIQASQSPAELKVAFAKYYKKYKDKSIALSEITRVYNEMKGQFSETSPESA